MEDIPHAHKRQFNSQYGQLTTWTCHGGAGPKHE
jgi:hypothetical protein